MALKLIGNYLGCFSEKYLKKDGTQGVRVFFGISTGLNTYTNAPLQTWFRMSEKNAVLLQGVQGNQVIEVTFSVESRLWQQEGSAPKVFSECVAFGLTPYQPQAPTYVAPTAPAPQQTPAQSQTIATMQSAMQGQSQQTGFVTPPISPI